MVGQDQPKLVFDGQCRHRQFLSVLSLPTLSKHKPLIRGSIQTKVPARFLAQHQQIHFKSTSLVKYVRHLNSIFCAEMGVNQFSLPKTVEKSSSPKISPAFLENLLTDGWPPKDIGFEPEGRPAMGRLGGGGRGLLCKNKSNKVLIISNLQLASNSKCGKYWLNQFSHSRLCHMIQQIHDSSGSGSGIRCQNLKPCPRYCTDGLWQVTAIKGLFQPCPTNLRTDRPRVNKLCSLWIVIVSRIDAFPYPALNYHH